VKLPWRKIQTDGTQKHILIIVAIFVVSISGVLWFSLWDDGYLGWHWERWDRNGDILCFDIQGRKTRSSLGDCYVLSHRGLKARERWADDCKSKGETATVCDQRAVVYMTRQLSHKYGIVNSAVDPQN
jgi:hypothetical protein